MQNYIFNKIIVHTALPQVTSQIFKLNCLFLHKTLINHGDLPFINIFQSEVGNQYYFNGEVQNRKKKSYDKHTDEKVVVTGII